MRRLVYNSTIFLGWALIALSIPLTVALTIKMVYIRGYFAVGGEIIVPMVIALLGAKITTRKLKLEGEQSDELINLEKRCVR